jgi:hypothetical protein
MFQSFQREAFRDRAMQWYIQSKDVLLDTFAQSKPCDSSFESHEDYKPTLKNMFHNDSSFVVGQFLDYSFAVTFSL